MRILVVDDHRDAADTMADILELMGHEVKASYDGARAVEVAAGFRPHVVLLDIGMPRLDGYAVAARLRDQPETRSTVLVALTGWGRGADKRRAMEAGFDHHLTKPVDPADLQKLLAGIETSK